MTVKVVAETAHPAGGPGGASAHVCKAIFAFQEVRRAAKSPHPPLPLITVALTAIAPSLLCR